MQIKAIKVQNYQNFLDTQLCLTEQFKQEAQNSLQEKNVHQSEQLQLPSRNQFNLRQAIYNQILRQEQKQERNHRKRIFTRENMSALSIKQRNIRKMNSFKTPISSPSKDSLGNSQDLQIKQAKITRINSAQSKRPLSSFSNRSLKNTLAFRTTEKLWKARPQTSATRPQTSVSKLSKNQVTENTLKYFQFRKQNPLVIYPFENHLRIKRIDENPKILANVISKKNKLLSKEELYQYVSKIMDRRPN